MRKVKAELLVIGGGFGGYTGAIRAAQLGLQVLLVEKEPRLGGVCLNRGCIPSKALIHAAELFHSAGQAAELGVRAGAALELELDFAQLQRWKEGIIERLAEGVARLCKGNGVQVLHGEARLTGPHSAEVVAADGPGEVGVEVEVEFEKALIATGSRPLALPGTEFDGQVVLNSTDVLNLKRRPEELLIVGGGYIGLELGMALAKLGVKVTVVEMMDQLLPGTDPELVRPVARRLRALGVEVHLRARVTKLERRGDHAELTVESPDGVRKLRAEKVLVSIGRRPNSEGLEAAGVATDERGYIEVDEDFRTSVENIYAVGDVIGGPLLAHKAAREGLLAAEGLAGREPQPQRFKHIPMAIFTDPEIATVGLTEAEARAQVGDDLLVVRFPYGALGRALTLALPPGSPEGFFKLIARKSSGELLGVGIVGVGASELLGEATLALELGATVEDLARAVHAHPTLSEGFQEAAELALGRPIHLLRARR